MKQKAASPIMARQHQLGEDQELEMQQQRMKQDESWWGYSQDAQTTAVRPPPDLR
jgi:hypothetical protein